MNRSVALFAAFVALANAQFGTPFLGNKGNFNAPPNFGPNCNINGVTGCACTAQKKKKKKLFFFLATLFLVLLLTNFRCVFVFVSVANFETGFLLIVTLTRKQKGSNRNNFFFFFFSQLERVAILPQFS
jgi:hypothetical protein